ncbi:MAG: hypothetical protein R6U11_01225, partial [Bacteroidales bacterium]
MSYFKHFFLVFAFYAFIANSNSQTTNQKALELLEEHKEVYLSIDAEDLNKELHLQLSLDYIEGPRAYVYANHEAFELLNSLGVEYTLERSPGDVDFEVNMKSW